LRPAGASLFFSRMDAGVFAARVAAGGRVVRYRGHAYVLDPTWTVAQRKSARIREMRRIDAMRASEGVGEVFGKMAQVLAGMGRAFSYDCPIPLAWNGACQRRLGGLRSLWNGGCLAICWAYGPCGVGRVEGARNGAGLSDYPGATGLRNGACLLDMLDPYGPVDWGVSSWVG
jgi:hypothetical protein